VHCAIFFAEFVVIK